MSQYPYPPGSGAGSGAGTGLSDDTLSVTEPGGDSAHAASGATGSSGAPSTTDVARDEAAGVGTTATQAGREVADTAKEQAAEVVHEAKDQARSLMDRTAGEVQDQAATQQQRAADSLRALSDELRSMADSQQEPGMATDLARQAADRTGQLASWLQDREPGDVLGEVTGFARRRPGTFLALAAGAGVIAGRLTRGMAAGSPSGNGASPGSGTSSGRHAASTRPFNRTTSGSAYSGDVAAGTSAPGAPDADLAPPMTRSPGLGDAGMGARDTGASGNDVTP